MAKLVFVNLYKSERKVLVAALQLQEKEGELNTYEGFI
jgi:hypothetical protein